MSKPDDQKNPAAVELGRLGGLKGGKARAAALTPERRSEIASNAARARWAKGVVVHAVEYIDPVGAEQRWGNREDV